MSTLAQARLVALREIRERGRSRAFRISMVAMILVVLAAIVLPAALRGGTRTRHVGLLTSAPAALASALEQQGAAADVPVRVRRYADRAAGEDAVRAGRIDMLVLEASAATGTPAWRVEWRRSADDRLQAVVTSVVQAVVVQQRAAAAGLAPDALAALLAPVPVSTAALGSVAGRSPDDETAALVMTVLLLLAISTYGNLVLTGVVEEKTSRVVEVLLARMPARALLAGKVAGIGLLGLAQFAVTALVAVVAMAAVDTVHVPATGTGVIAWAVVWFALGYALYATAYGALGALASRPEDAQSAAGPVMVLLLVGYGAAIAAIGRPDSGFARWASFLPPTAPLAMPTRVAMGATAWWEPVLAAAITAATIALLVRLGGRVYAGAVLHSGAALPLRTAWRGTAPSVAAGTDNPAAETPRRVQRRVPWWRPLRSRAPSWGRGRRARTASRQSSRTAHRTGGRRGTRPR